MTTTPRRRRAPAAAAAPPQPLTAADLAAFMGDESPDPEDDAALAALDWARAMVASWSGAPVPDAPPHNLRQALLLTAASWLLTGGENPDETIPLQARYLLKLHAADRA